MISKNINRARTGPPKSCRNREVREVRERRPARRQRDLIFSGKNKSSQSKQSKFPRGRRAGLTSTQVLTLLSADSGLI